MNERKKLIHFILHPSLFVLILTAGCGSKATSIPAWQQSVTRYVSEEAQGDPTVLRDVTLADDRPGFSVIGHHDTRLSTDANGLLLGHEQAGGRMWLVYLVGLVEKERVSDVRLAALSMDNGKTVWRRGKGSKDAMGAYRAHGMKQVKERFPDRKRLPPRYAGFPKPDDVFKLTNENGKLVATHEASGARWELTLPAQER